MLDQILDMIPDEMRDHPMAKMLNAFLREGKKDLRRIPAEYIVSLSKQLGEAFMWVAEGSMSDVAAGTEEVANPPENTL